MAVERFANLAGTLLNGAYTSGSGVLNVDSTAAPFPQTGNFRVAVADPTTFAVKVLLKVTAINSATQFAVTAEGSDANGADNDLCKLVLTNDGLGSMFADALQFGTYANLPATTNQRLGNRYLCTDSPYECVFDGSAWDHFIPSIGQVTQPPTSGWSWVNQGGASVVTTHGGLQLLAPAGAGDNHRVYVRTPGNSTFVASLLFTPEIFTENSVFCGLYFRESGTGKLSAIGVTNSGGSYGVRANRWASPTTSGVAISSLIFPVVRFHHFVIVQMELTSTDVIYRVAYDNRTQYYQVATESKTTSFTTAPDQYGIGVNSNNATYLAGMTAWSIVET